MSKIADMTNGNAAMSIDAGIAKAGHNNPPPEILFADEIEAAYALAADSLNGPITDDNQEAAITDILATIKRLKKDADDARAEEKRPHDAAAKAVQDKWKPVLTKADIAIAALQGPLTGYRTAKRERIRAEAEAAAQAVRDAERRVIAAEQAARSLGGDLETLGGIIAESDRLKKEAAKANRATKAATGLRTQWVAHVTDYGAALKWLKERRPDDLKAAIDELARREVHAGVRAIDGVEIKEERKAT